MFSKQQKAKCLDAVISANSKISEIHLKLQWVQLIHLLKYISNQNMYITDALNARQDNNLRRCGHTFTWFDWFKYCPIWWSAETSVLPSDAACVQTGHCRFLLAVSVECEAQEVKEDTVGSWQKMKCRHFNRY